VKFEEITDGISNTILLVEVHNSGIHWMEPRDLDASQMAMAINANPARKGVIPGISSGHPGVAQAAMADGSVRALPDDTPPATVRAMLTIAGGETVQRP
jgi:prepilin-type processing-associated H-X9-DG protein